MMGIRTLCFILMVVITPYGWYTWVLGAAAILLPYVAVVLANVSQSARPSDPENPERALPPAAPVDDIHPAAPPTLRFEEIRAVGNGEQPGEKA